MNSYEKFHLKEVINASGKMTILGVSKVSGGSPRGSTIRRRTFL
ncbi:hypothetical protein EfsSVR2281_37750 [Enterococcus faecalis]|nr:hypothetical protein EfsSVR2281_37750 [Enterococcus faecalis]